MVTDDFGDSRLYVVACVSDDAPTLKTRFILLDPFPVFSA